MTRSPDVDEVARALRASIGLLLRRLRQVTADGELSLPETAALTRLDRGGSTTSSALARLEQISPQSMGATLAGLEAQGLVERGRDPEDGRRSLVSITETGRQALGNLRNARIALLARGLSSGFTPAELSQLLAIAPLLERLVENI